jgi:hypothetical protein
MEYKIKITYRTGNSFGSHTETEYLGLSWKNLDIAKENLQFINEHHNLNNLSGKKLEKAILLNKNKPWFVLNENIYYKDKKITKKQEEELKLIDNNLDNFKYKINSYDYEYCIKLKADNGNFMQMSCFWVGYFESILSAKIEVDTSDMEINF